MAATRHEFGALFPRGVWCLTGTQKALVTKAPASSSSQLHLWYASGHCHQYIVQTYNLRGRTTAAALPILRPNIRGESCHNFSQRFLANRTRTPLLYQLHPVAPVVWSSPFDCRSRQCLSYTHLANVGAPVLWAISTSVLVSSRLWFPRQINFQMSGADISVAFYWPGWNHGKIFVQKGEEGYSTLELIGAPWCCLAVRVWALHESYVSTPQGALGE